MYSSIFNKGFNEMINGFNSYNLKTDIVEHDDKYEIFIETPGVLKEDINLSIDDNDLIVEIKCAKEQQDGNVILCQRYKGDIKRTYYLENISSTVTAKLDNGILNIVVYKKADSKNNANLIMIE